MMDDFSAFQLVDHNPEAIVLGDMDEGFAFNLINNLFNHILGCAELIAMHNNRFWISAESCLVNIGAFVSALEYASGIRASVMGKPDSNLFVLAAKDWNFLVISWWFEMALRLMGGSKCRDEINFS